jgi:hypothetical protein
MVTTTKPVAEIKTNGHHKIQTVPLTQILDEIENSIKLANEAAKNAREAADEARKAGEKAAGEAARVAEASIAKVDEIARRALKLVELLKVVGVDTAAYYEKRVTEESRAIESS